MATPKKQPLPDVKDDPFPYDSWIIYGLAIIGAFLLGIAIYKELNPEYIKYQREFKSLIEKKFGKEVASKITFGVKQIWIPELGKVERCITCHMGYEWKGLDGEDVPKVFRTHPDLKGLIAKHPFKKFGCTTCHGGQGYATNLREAHVIHEGKKKVRWLEPLLSAEKAKEYGFKDWQKLPLMEINCNICHRYEDSVPGMPYINLAKKLVEEKACKTCHIINGEGGKIGPDLTYEGSKMPEMFDMRGPYYEIKDGKPVKSGRSIKEEIERRGLPLTIFSWHLLHFEEPRSITPTSTMPNFGFTDDENRALTMLVMSWKKVKLPAEYIPRIKRVKKVEAEKGAQDTIEVKESKPSDTTQMEGAQEEKGTPEVSEELVKRGESIFNQKCKACHLIDKKLVGPALKGLFSRRTEKWVFLMITKPDSMIKNDPEAKKLFEEYKVPMIIPGGITDEETKAVIEYLKRATK